MSLQETLNSDLKTALKSRESERADLIRNLKSDIKYKEIDKKGPLSEDDLLTVLSSAAKKRREAIEQFQAGGRQDLVERETRQLNWINEYLPQPLTDAEIGELVQAALAESGATAPGDIGKVMKIIMPQVKGRADGNKIRELISAKLTG